MAKTVLVEWDSQELRVGVLGSAGLSSCFTAPLEDVSPAAIAGALKSIVDNNGLARSEALVAVSRRDVEVREIVLPPAPIEDHPDMVRLMAPREFTQFDDNAVVDFYQIGQPDDRHQMFAAAIEGAAYKKVTSIIQDAGLTTKWLALRPLCSAALVDQEPPKPRLVIDLGSEEADIAVHNGQHVLGVRNVRLPVEGRGDALQRDLKRTLVIAANQLGRPVSEIVLFGSAEEHADLTASWDLDAELRFIAGAVPQGQSARFASLAGLGVIAASGNEPAMNFANPRKRPPPQKRVTTAMILAGALALLVLLGIGSVFRKLGKLSEEVATLTKDLKKAKEATAKASTAMAHQDLIETFLESNVNWLDEMRHVSNHSMKYSDVTFTKWFGRSITKESGGGTLLLDGNARHPDTLDELEEKLRNEAHVVDGRGHVKDPKNSAHPYRFRQMAISIAPPSKLASLAAENAAQQEGESPSDVSPDDPKGASKGASEAPSNDASTEATEETS